MASVETLQITVEQAVTPDLANAQSLVLRRLSAPRLQLSVGLLGQLLAPRPLFQLPTPPTGCPKTVHVVVLKATRVLATLRASVARSKSISFFFFHRDHVADEACIDMAGAARALTIVEPAATLFLVDAHLRHLSRFPVSLQLAQHAV